MDIKMIRLQTHGDDRGSLVALEQENNIPFEIKRVYYMFKTGQNVRRGCHAHRRLRQVAIAVRGSCRFLLDNGREQIELLLDNPAQGLLIDSFIWREMYEFSEDCVLMVLADQLYDETDYVRNYNDFLEIAKKAPLISQELIQA
ncbi:FdtA/QdtA family cupin domain-containing protein [Pseudescherichia sp.]|uniref:sugar 3,4-ketoisomerase n=1 Tax=Pseudescherichia sp. TaxID=2055881 RepID=UPI00289B7111|nr:FdtA/QdtA family cupin domain-containing protein [Pseudescherichia sp.]